MQIGILISILLLLIIYCSWRINRIEDKIHQMLSSDQPTYKQTAYITKRIDELEKWVDFYHRDRNQWERDKYIAWLSELELAKRWCEAKKMSSKETERYLKNRRQAWSKEYNQAHPKLT